MDRLLLTVEQVEESTAICRSKIYEYMASGQLRSIKIGRSRRVARTDLEAFIERLRAEQWPESPLRCRRFAAPRSTVDTPKRPHV